MPKILEIEDRGNGHAKVKYDDGSVLRGSMDNKSHEQEAFTLHNGEGTIGERAHFINHKLL